MHTLAEHAKRLSGIHLRELLADKNRNNEFAREAADVLLDFSRQRIDPDALTALLQFAEQKDVREWTRRMFDGEQVNNTERRAALHMALRATAGDTYSTDGGDVLPDVLSERCRMLEFAQAIRDGTVRGCSGKQLTRIINIGIGGSDLGVAMACAALENWRQPDIDCYFVSAIDGVQLQDALADADPGSTLFIVCSKSFSTIETLDNANLARDWLYENLGQDAVADHFVAVSCNEQAMDQFGIAASRRFAIWDWVGGRYSLWSSMGLVLAIAIGTDHFLDFLSGGRDMDIHFREADIQENLPVLMAVLSLWNNLFQDAASHVVLPYDQRLAQLPRYLQQLIMESLGKRVTRDGAAVEANSDMATWGEPGSNAQHAFMQWLHQGTISVSVDFILPVRGSSRFPQRSRAATAQCLGQAQALAFGRSEAEINKALTSLDLPDEQKRALLPHMEQPGNRPSSLIWLPCVDPRNLGRLVALYEHRVFVQGVLWGINPFDQFGVELGKQLARQTERDMRAGKSLPDTLGRYLERHAER